jgi:outer membrane lipoprotein SlyB
VPNDYETIQDAIDHADSGDTITIRSENGSDYTIVQAADSSDDIFEVIEDYVNIRIAKFYKGQIQNKR